MSLIGRYNSYRPIETISDRYLFIGFIGISLSADIVIGRYQKNLYRAYSSVYFDMIKRFKVSPRSPIDSFLIRSKYATQVEGRLDVWTVGLGQAHKKEK